MLVIRLRRTAIRNRGHVASNCGRFRRNPPCVNGRLPRQLWQPAEVADKARPIELFLLIHQCDYFFRQRTTDQLHGLFLRIPFGNQAIKGLLGLRRITVPHLVFYDLKDGLPEILRRLRIWFKFLCHGHNLTCSERDVKQ